LAKTVKKRDEFTDAYMDYYPLVFGAIYSKVGNKEEAEDICQEVFIIFFDKYDEIENKRRWLYGTLKNVVLRYYQRKKDDHLDIDDIFNDVSLTFVNGFRDSRLIIEEAIEKIDCTEEDRLVLDMIAYNNFTYGHVAETLGVTRRQIEYRYGKIVKKITDYLKEKGIKDMEELL